MASAKRQIIDCRLYPSDTPCTLSIAGTEEEVLDAAVHHATTRHKHKNTPELRNQLKTLLKDDQ